MTVDKPAPLSVTKPYTKPPDQKKPEIKSTPALSSTAVKPPAKASTMPAKPPGKGPKTFDEMGVPAQQKDGECVSLHDTLLFKYDGADVR